MQSAIEDGRNAIETATAQLTGLAAELGVSMDELEAEADPLPEEERRQPEAWNYLEAVVAVTRGAERAGVAADDGKVLEAGSGACLLCGKLSWILDAAGPEAAAASDETWPDHTVPNLLLVEKVDSLVAQAVAILADSDESLLASFSRARAALLGRLRPWLEAIPPTARAELDELCLTGRAPSPFLRLPSSRGPQPFVPS
jgi:hypothetical protein